MWQGGKTCEGNFQQASKFFRQMALMSSCASAAVVFTLEKHVNANISYEYIYESRSQSDMVELSIMICLMIIDFYNSWKRTAICASNYL